MFGKKRVRRQFNGEVIRSILKWDTISAAFALLFRKDTWKRVFSADSLKEFFGCDLISALHVFGIILIATFCVWCFKKEQNGSMVAVVGGFAYFNVFVTIVVARNLGGSDMRKAAWNLVWMWLLAIGVGFILFSICSATYSFLGACVLVGLFALPGLLVFNADIRRLLFDSLFMAIDNAFSGNTPEELFGSVLGAVLGLVIVILFVLVFGAFVVLCQYIGVAAGFCFATGLRFAKPEEAPHFAEGVIAEDVDQPIVSNDAIPQDTGTNPQGTGTNHQAKDEDEFFIE